MRLPKQALVLSSLILLACSSSGTGGVGGGSAAGGGTAVGGGAGGGASGTITVAGRVLSLRQQPLANATVVIIGKPSTTSDAMGKFSIAGVTTPYDIATVASGAATTYITIIKQLTRADPTLFALASGTTTLNSGMVTGDITGTGLVMPTPANRTTRVLFDAPEASASTGVPNNPYSLDVSWTGPITITGSVYALQWVKSLATDLPTSYSGYGKVDAVLAAGNTAAMKNITTTTVASALLAGTVTVPAVSSLMLTSKTIALVIGNGSMNLGSDTTPSTGFSFTTPVIPNSTLGLTVAAEGALRSTSFTRNDLANNATGVNFTLASPPQLSLPVQTATGIALATQSFSWSPMAPTGLYYLLMTAGTRSFAIFTASPSVILPSTTELGLGTLPASTSFSWKVTGFGGGATTTDLFTGPTSIQTISPTTGDSWRADSETRTFTIQ